MLILLTHCSSRLLYEAWWDSIENASLLPGRDPHYEWPAGEAMGAIGDPSVLPLLTRLSSDPTPEVAETCQLAVRRIHWLQDEKVPIRVASETGISGRGVRDSKYGLSEILDV